MQVKLTLMSGSKIVLSRYYNHILQALIYNMFDKNFAKWLHEKGFIYEKRTFKHFTFSSILEYGRIDKRSGTITFSNKISFILSSAVEQILEQFARNAVTKEKIRLGRNELYLDSVLILPQPEIKSDKIRINTLSPIEVHSTLEKMDGTKKTYYYAPQEKEFSQLVNKNLQKKWQALYDEECSHEIKIYPVRAQYLKKSITKYKDFVVQGWKGHFFLESEEPRILQFALDSGIGSKSSQGFGNIERVLEKN